MLGQKFVVSFLERKSIAFKILKSLRDRSKVRHCHKLSSNCHHLVSTYQVPGTGLSPYMCISLVLTATRQGEYCCHSRLTDEDTEAGHLPEIKPGFECRSVSASGIQPVPPLLVGIQGPPEFAVNLPS